jgi:hypothetical protein
MDKSDVLNVRFPRPDVPMCGPTEIMSLQTLRCAVTRKLWLCRCSNVRSRWNDIFADVLIYDLTKIMCLLTLWCAAPLKLCLCRRSDVRPHWNYAFADALMYGPTEIMIMQTLWCVVPRKSSYQPSSFFCLVSGRSRRPMTECNYEVRIESWARGEVARSEAETARFAARGMTVLRMQRVPQVRSSTVYNFAGETQLHYGDCCIKGQLIKMHSLCL